MVPEGVPGRGRGRGRGRGTTQLGKWELYKPGPDVYQQLWRVRKEPAIVTANPPEECPIDHAQTRILDRRQTEGPIVRSYYVVRITRTDDGGAARHDTEDVDLSRILQYVSPSELERFENEQFRLEAEAEAIAVRAEIEELARRRLQVNARGRGRGDRVISSQRLPPESQPRARGRPKGRRGRGRGRPRAPSVRGDGMGEQLQDSPGAIVAEDEESHRVIPETEDEEEILETPSQPSPGLMRSAFVANSALSVSPIHKRLSTPTAYRPLVKADGPAMSVTLQDQDLDRDEHRIKRLRLESPHSAEQTSIPSPPQIPTEAFAQAVLFSDRSSAIDLDSSPYPQTKPPSPPSPDPEYDSSIPAHTPSATLNDAPVPNEPQRNGDYNRGNDSVEEEYVVESILEHYHDGEKTYYLVKWEGYDDSHDWLPEEDLDGARELVSAYKKRVGIGTGRKKKGAFFI